MIKRPLFIILLLILALKADSQVAFVPEGGPEMRLIWTVLPVMDGKLEVPHFFGTLESSDYRVWLNSCLPSILLPVQFSPEDLLNARGYVHIYGKMLIVNSATSLKRDTYEDLYGPHIVTPSDQSDGESSSGLPKGKGPGAALGIGFLIIKAVCQDHNWGGGNTDSPEPK
jgi:hypothetical protein